VKKIDYYFWINSDWAYLGHDRLEALAAKHQVRLDYKPVDLPYVYNQTGGVLLSKRSPERQRYRIQELERWTKRLGIHVNPEPKYMCPNGDLASCVVIAALRREEGRHGPLAKAILQAEWVLDQDISDPSVLARILDTLSLDVAGLMSVAQSAEVRAEYERNTLEAIQAGVFGSPSYVYNGEVFWGQDRLEFLEQSISG
jgi:2-hydroxychromene-2-carboxylate isomerase